MMEWVLRIADRVDQLAKADPEYQELAKRQTELMPDYEALLDYMDVVGNMQYRISQLAWLYGKRHPHD